MTAPASSITSNVTAITTASLAKMKSHVTGLADSITEGEETVRKIVTKEIVLVIPSSSSASLEGAGEEVVCYSPFMNSLKLVIPLRSLYWSIHTKDESKRGTAFAFIFGVN